MCSVDFSAWEELKKTVVPLNKKGDRQPVPIPPRLRVNRKEVVDLMDCLDLHGMTIQEAYETLCRFLMAHERAGTAAITVITGKGFKGVGKIKSEFMSWMDTPFFKERIREIKWFNDGGAVTLYLRRKKK